MKLLTKASHKISRENEENEGIAIKNNGGNRYINVIPIPHIPLEMANL